MSQNKRRVLLLQKKPTMKHIEIQTSDTIPKLFSNSPASVSYYDLFPIKNESRDSALDQTLSSFSQMLSITSAALLTTVQPVPVTNNLRRRAYHRSGGNYSFDMDMYASIKCDICKSLPCLCKKWKKIEDSYKLKITQNHFLTDVIKKKKQSRPSSAFIQYAESLNQSRRSLPLNGWKRSASKNAISILDLNDSVNIKQVSKPAVFSQNSKHNIETVVIPQAQTESKTYNRILTLIESYLKATKSPEQIKQKLNKFYVYIKKHNNQKRNISFTKKIQTIAKFIAIHHEKLKLNSALIPLIDIELVTPRHLLMFDRFLCSLFRLVE